MRKLPDHVHHVHHLQHKSNLTIDSVAEMLFPTPAPPRFGFGLLKAVRRKLADTPLPRPQSLALGDELRGFQRRSAEVVAQRSRQRLRQLLPAPPTEQPSRPNPFDRANLEQARLAAQQLAHRAAQLDALRRLAEIQAEAVEASSPEPEATTTEPELPEETRPTSEADSGGQQPM